MELAELHRTIHGRTVERDVVSGEMYRKTRKTRPWRMSQNVRSASPWAGPSRRGCTLLGLGEITSG